MTTASRPLQESKREEILAAAIRCFAERGYEGTSTREIARDAGAKPPLLFYHFGSKGDLYLAAVLYQLERLSEALTAALADIEDDLERLQTFVQVYYDHFTVHEPGLSVCLRELRVLPTALGEQIADTHSRVATSVLERIIAEGIAHGTFRPFDPWACAFAVTGILQGFMRLRASTQERLGPQAAVQQVLDVYCAGLVTAQPDGRTLPR